MPRVRQIATRGRWVISWTRRSRAVFFYLIPGRVQNLDLHRLAPQRALELLDPLLGLPEQGHGDDFLIRGHRRVAPPLDQVFPPPHHRR